MKIHGSKPSKMNGSSKIGVYQNQKIQKQNSDKSLKGDSIQLSKRGKDISRILKNSSDSSDLRTDVVDKIKKEIKDGSYKVYPDKLADKIIRHINKREY